MSVFWLLAAKESLRAALNGSTVGFEPWIERIDAVLVEAFAKQTILVRDYFRGYREFYGIVILFVEVHPTNESSPGRFQSPGTYIVKVAFDNAQPALQKEIAAWNKSRPKHLRSDSVFVSLEAHPDDKNPKLLVYGDAQAGLGGRNVVSLEYAWTQSCRFGVPLPESIDRELRTLYDRMGAHFFPHAHLEPASKYLSAHRPDLQILLDRYNETVMVTADRDRRHDHKRRQLRRETLALLANDHEYYADPIDLLAGLKAAGVGPEVLRGTGHGDLHGRNIQVSITNDEVSHPAVYDYERFHTENFPAWDFIRLEVETSVRLLDRFGERSSLAGFIQQCLTFWRHVAERTKAVNDHTTISTELKLPGPEWNRLADRLVQLRLLAHEHLGKNRGRVYEWLDEYELLTTWYACRAALYDNYEPRWTVAALIAAGVAARRLMRRLPATVELSHRRRFVEARNLARSDDSARRLQGQQELSQLCDLFPHVLEIKEELALVLIKLTRNTEAEQLLNAVAISYDHTSAEIPCRWGALWKRRAFAEPGFDLHSLQEALKWYRRAMEIEPANYYPRINVATLLLILGKHDESQKEAENTQANLDSCEKRDHWWLATKGEATLLEGKDIQAAFEWYRRAVNHRDCKPSDRHSMRDQLKFLRRHLDEPLRAKLSDEFLESSFSPQA